MHRGDPAKSPCHSAFERYDLGGRLDEDRDAVVRAALKYFAEASNNRGMVVFDVDDTMLDLREACIRRQRYTGVFNKTLHREAQRSGNLPAIPGTRRLFHQLYKLGFGL